MRKLEESPADRLWREKLDSCMSLPEALVLLIVVAVLAAGVFVAS